jgi:hypothetical protein
MMSIVPFPKTSEGKQTRSRSRDKATRAAGQAAIDAPYKRKLIAFDADTWHALHLLARDMMKDIQELSDEAFADVLKKYHRPTGLKEALRQSARKQERRTTARPQALAFRQSTYLAPPRAHPRMRDRERNPLPRPGSPTVSLPSNSIGAGSRAFHWR